MKYSLLSWTDDMLKIKIKTQTNTKILDKVTRALKAAKGSTLSVGYHRNVKHWYSDITLPELASFTYYDSSWSNQTMIDTKHTPYVRSVVDHHLNILFNRLDTSGGFPFSNFIRDIGKEFVGFNIKLVESVDTPPNSAKWAAIKTFNDPLVYGSKIGKKPNLISEISYRVSRNKVIENANESN